MKKIKFIALAFMLSVMFMGAGYAAWQDNLSIKNTVQTGQLHMKFVNDNKVAQKSQSLQYPYAFGAEYVTPTITVVNDNTVQVTIDKLYPGAWAAFRLKAINSGSIPAKFDNVVVEFGGDKEELLPYLTYETGLRVDEKGTNENQKYIKFNGALQGIGAKFNSELNKLKDVQLEPNDKGSVYLGAYNVDDKSKDGFMVIRYSKDAPNTTQNKTLTFTIKFNFKQFNQ